MSPILISPRSASRRAEAEGRMKAAAFARLIAALALARGLLRMDFTTREQAVAARARLVAAIEPCLDLAATDPDLLDRAVAAYGLALQALDTRIIRLNPLVRIDTAEPDPAALIAWQVYADTARMDDLCALNGDRTPEFMPTRMIGVAPGPAPDLRGDVIDPR